MNAPWMPDQVASLNGFQVCGHQHPFTCGFCRAVLWATRGGWVCDTKGCSYTQNRCHTHMADWSWRRDDDQ